MMTYTTQYTSPVGKLILASDGKKLTGLWRAGQKYFAATLTEPPMARDRLPVLIAARKWLDRYFAGRPPAIADLPLSPAGGEFRQAVWRLLCQIPYGQVVTYGDLAKQIAVRQHRPAMSAQAIGGAVGHNPISIIIPCHRVIGANGNLTGYAAGLPAKIQLLTHEGVNMTRLFTPAKSTAP
ncbi:MAG: methylated-DNA--[protein]-cysteine S-methyltransferase [Verrucomicrobiales bacterium]|jgi:methylated-DNA-[protein]-cysteine S-methyltransferase|nr:methylated-DNA--[protein]-cysteine S-methyltransferase [Verrucomicrobiales bacterium]